MEIETPQPPVTVHEVNIKVNALESGWISGILEKVMVHDDFKDLFSIDKIVEMQAAFALVADR